MKYFLGIDPGWTHLGWAICNEDFKIVASGTSIPKMLTRTLVPDEIQDAVAYFCEDGEVEGCCMERYVTYKGKHNPASEQILMVTGQLQYMVHDRYEVKARMFKAYDWKSSLLKHLVQDKGFSNPAQGLDKEFSMAAAECAYDWKFDNDHEADAACLAFIAALINKETTK